MTKPFVKLSDPILRKIAGEISVDKIYFKQTQRLIQKMLKVAYGEQKDKRKPIMMGLAAPQLGISNRIILIDVAADGRGKVGDLRVFINPEITWTSKKEEEWYEGCYSISKVCGIVSRPISIKIRAFSLQPRWATSPRSGLHRKVEQVQKKYSGYVARIFQHEIDHLDGKFFVDLIKNPDHLHKVKAEEFPLYRNKAAWRNWPKKYSLPLASFKL